MEFLEHGITYVFPAASGALTRRIPTAHAHPFMSHLFPSEEPYVWPDPEGEIRGIAIDTLYPGVTKAIRIDQNL